MKRDGEGAGHQGAKKEGGDRGSMQSMKRGVCLRVCLHVLCVCLTLAGLFEAAVGGLFPEEVLDALHGLQPA